VFVTKKEENNFNGVFQDGTEINKIRYESTVEFIEYKNTVQLN